MDYLKFTPNEINRRVFIKGMGFVSIALLMGAFGGCEAWIKMIRERPMRRMLRTGSSEVDADIATYREAVRLMKELTVSNPSDPRGWAKQAAIHGAVNGGFNFCQHGTKHFFSWHRAYLIYFEKICQELTGNPRFGLPYWNWNQTPAMHAAFLDHSSPLYASRGRETMKDIHAVSNATLDTIFTDPNFFTFGRQIEVTPHSMVHMVIGDGSFFGGPGSAMDPIFWAHHCMVDYCWAKWNIEMIGNNPNEASWLDERWDHFVNADATPVTTTAGMASLGPLLLYQYESSDIGTNPAVKALRNKKDFKKLVARVKKGTDVQFIIKERFSIVEKTAISIARPFSHETMQKVDSINRIIENRENELVFASIEYAQLPPASDFFVRLFINKPDATSATSDSDPHFAGSFAFFGTEPNEGDGHEGHGDHKPQLPFLVNLIPVLQTLKKMGELTPGSNLSVQLVAVPLNGQFERPDTAFVLNKVELIITPMVINSDVAQQEKREAIR